MDLAVTEVVRPRSLDEALALLAARPDLRPLAGGTDLVVQLRAGRRRAPALLDLRGAGLVGVRETAAGLEIGAATTMDAIASSPLVARRAPALARAAGWVGAWPIQCRATLGGNLANASPAADTAPALLVAGARLRLSSAAGERELAIDDFFLGPGRTALAAGELLTAVVLPAPWPVGGHERFVKLGPRREQVIAVVSVAIRVAADADGSLRDLRLALGAVAPTPVRARRTEAVIAGRRFAGAVREEALATLQEEISPIDDLRAPASYRRHAAAVLVSRLLAEVTSG